MVSFEPILVTHDGSEVSRTAVAHARLLASALGARTVIVHVVAPVSRDPAGALRANAVREGTALLAEEARRFATPVETRILYGAPAESIVACAEELGAGLVVLGTRGRSPLEGLFLGSVARYVLRGCRRPVLVVHRSVPSMRSIVAGVDGSEVSPRVVTLARALASSLQARLLLATVVDADRDLAERPQQYGIAADVWSEAVKTHADRVFAPLRALAGGAEERVMFGPAVEGLRDAAVAQGAEIVVVGRKGRSGLDVDAWFSVAFSLAIRGPFGTLVV